MLTELLARMMLVEWAAKDLQYGSDGESFYSLHLLADKVSLSGLTDDLKEAACLGNNAVPPPMEEISKKAIELKRPVDNTGNVSLVSTLHDSCSDVIYLIEEVKRLATISAGVHAILDSISQHLLVVKGLCWRTMNA